ncbi:hypothetical protein [Actinoallomurus iriomotensis]|uniref:Uncharacterized protein n=1 Tax=Actinoallomurus iriomotensis TaxID=478107 RepID=A0A9W6S3Y4_9ACTN|nr:hypothetical protein [Actinoallomurus iriomotensis]GLY87735.1 hypothetical protein Airi02_056640 [Actinoallomurus iriomotensis]
MAVTADQVATLRAFLARDFDRYERLHAQLDPVAAKTGYTALIAAAFIEAVDRRFHQDSTDSDVVEFVGAVRAQFDRDGDEIDPIVAERMIRAVYTDEDIDDIDTETLVGNQVVLLSALIAEENLDDSELDAFLAKAGELADQWTS